MRKARGLSQQRFADLASLHVIQIKRYEAGAAQATLDALVNLAQALHVSLDNMVFEEGERGPPDELRLQFEAISHFTSEEKEVACTVLESVIPRHTANRFSCSAQQASC